MNGRRLDPGAHGGPALPVPYREFRPDGLQAGSSVPFWHPTSILVFSDKPEANTVVDGPDSAVKIVDTCQPPNVPCTNGFVPFSSGKGTSTLATNMCGRLICVLPLSRLGLPAQVRV